MNSFPYFVGALALLTQLIALEAAISTTEAGETSDGENVGDSLDWHDSVCVEHNGGYARKPDLGISCCKNQTLMLPIGLVENWYSNLQLIECANDFLQSESTDLPTTLWNVTLCVLKNSSAFPANKVTFQNFFKFMTSAYPKDIITELETSSKDCGKEGTKETTPVAKLRKYFECFHNSEKKVCDKPYKPVSPISSDKYDKKYDCPEMVGLNGIERRDYCCKKQSVPYNFLQFFEMFPQEEEYQQLSDTCEESFKNKQLELDPKLKAEVEKFENLEESGTLDESGDNPTERLINCNVACNILASKYYKGLVLSFDKVIANMTNLFGKKVQADLKTILNNRKSSMKFPNGVTQKLTFDELNKKFKAAPELTKIKYYCGFADVIKEEVERALHEYCFDKAFADIWLSENHH